MILQIFEIFNSLLKICINLCIIFFEVNKEMLIEGMQKLTLLDYPEHVACTLFSHGCNLRCPFCHNAGLVVRPPENNINIEEITKFFERRKGILDGVCLTGGEPLLQKDALDFMRFVRSFGYKLKLDTNGFYPEVLEKAIKEGLVDYIAMDIKSSKMAMPRLWASKP